MLDLDFVIAVHDEILGELGGLPGFAGGDSGRLEAALERVANQAYYNGIDDVFGIAAMYAVAIARGHPFADANKRTGLACCLTYLDQQGYPIPEVPEFEDAMVGVAEGQIDHDLFSAFISTLWETSQIDEDDPLNYD